MNPEFSLKNAVSLVVLFCALTNLVLGGLVLYDSPRRKVNRLFTLLCVTLFGWGMSFIGLNYCHSVAYSHAWVRLYAACMLFVPPIFYHLILGSIGNPLKGQDFALSDFYERLRQ